MNTSQLLKVAGFLNALHGATEPDHPGATRMGRAAGLGAAGAGLGAVGGYIHTARDFASRPGEYQGVLEHLARNPEQFGQVLAEAKIGGPASFESMKRLHSALAPAIAKAVPRKLALPALAIGGLGALAGAGLPTHHTTPGERLRKLWDRRPDLLK